MGDLLFLRFAVRLNEERMGLDGRDFVLPWGGVVGIPLVFHLEIGDFLSIKTFPFSSCILVSCYSGLEIVL